MLLFFAGCGNQPHKPVLHLFTDASTISGTHTLHDFDEDNPLVSGLTYPHDDALWKVQHEGKDALRFESTVLGQLRGTNHLLHQKIPAKDFELTCSSWLELDMEPAWSGITFWMNDVHRAMGVRWQPSHITNQITLEIFQYGHTQAYEIRTIKSVNYPISQSKWAAVKLSVQDNTVTVRLDDFEPLSATVEEERFYLGNHFGLFQGEGTGYFADIVWSASGESHSIIRWNNWNSEMVNTTKKVVLDNFTTPEHTLGLDIPVRRISLAKEWRSVVPVQCPSELRFEVTIPANARLHVGYGILQPFALSSTKAKIEVVIDDGSNDTIIAEREFQPRNESARWFQYHDIHKDLSAFAHQTVNLKLRMAPVEGDEPLVMCWSEPIITTKRISDKPNVLLFMVDTLRADRLGVYGYEKDLSPIIDEWSRTGTTFLNTICQAPWTTPSHASLFTGLYPSETNCDHTSNSSKNLLREGYWTWAELLQENGYATSAFTSGLQVRGELGFHQGFDTYHEIDYDSSYSVEANFEQFKSWLDEYQDVPWFNFMHTYAVHFPYKHKIYDDYRTLVRSWEDRRKHNNDTYDGGVRFIDEYFGSVLQELKQRGELENTIIILTSDHGEALGDRQMPHPARHGHSLYDELLKVPLIISAPDGVPEGKLVNKQVRLLDLLPTVLDLCAIDAPVWCHGLSLSPLMEGTETLERPAISEGLNYGFPLRSIRTSTHKLIQLTDPNRTLDPTSTGIPVPRPASVQMYNLTKDPEETQNIGGENQAKLEELQTVLNILTSPENMFDPSFFNAGLPMQAPPQPSAQMSEQLNSLGYTSN